MNLGEFYERVEALAASLAEQGRFKDGRSVMEALRGGSTSGEILANLFTVLERIADTGADGVEIGALLDFIRHAHDPPSSRS